MIALLLEKKNRTHWALMPFVLDRVREFCKRWESVADPEQLCQQIVNCFVLGNPAVIVLALIDEANGALVGHVLAETSDWAGSRFATILQYELDQPQPTDAQPRRAFSLEDRRRGFAAIEEWARQQKCLGVQVFARNPKVARAFRAYGLSQNAVLMRKPVESPIASEGEVSPSGHRRPAKMPMGV